MVSTQCMDCLPLLQTHFSYGWPLLSVVTVLTGQRHGVDTSGTLNVSVICFMSTEARLENGPLRILVLKFLFKVWTLRSTWFKCYIDASFHQLYVEG